MHLFSSRTRPDQGPARRCESQFSYLDRSGRAEAGRVRDLIEEWLAHYPASQHDRLIGDLRSDKDPQHLGAFLELVIHEALRSVGANIQVGPIIEGSKKVPDFLVNVNNLEFYLEATSGFEYNPEQGSPKALRHAMDEIDKVKSDRFFVSVKHSGVPARTPSGAKLRREVQNWLNSLNYDEVLRAWEEQEWEKFNFELEVEGARLILKPIPKKQIDDKVDRLIGMEMPDAGYLSTADVVRGRLIDKANRYGRLDKPYVVVVNLFGLAPDRGDVLDALFGTRAASVTWHSDGSHVARTVRLSDGAWFRGASPRYTRLSGVIWTQGLSPWSLASRTFELIHNPAASFPLPNVGLPLPTLVPRGDRLELGHVAKAA